jgi:hypothetical protein
VVVVVVFVVLIGLLVGWRVGWFFVKALIAFILVIP